MKFILLPAVALAPSALAAVLPIQETQELQIVLQVDKLRDRAAIDVYNHDKSSLIAQSCSRTLSSGGLEIAFEVDKNGGGTLTVGSRTYNVNDPVEATGGTICTRISTKDEVIVNCVVPNSQPVSAIAKRDLKTCFPEGPIHLVEVLESFAATARNESVIVSAAQIEAEEQAAAASAAALAQDSELEKRQGICGAWAYPIFKVGNGDPHQNPWNVQLSVPMTCDSQRSCAIQWGTAKSFSVGWHASLSRYGWADVGFAVQQSVETSNNYQCDGNPGDTFAIWKNVGTTAYTVYRHAYNGCRSEINPNYILWSPNKNDKYSEFYCVYGREYVRNIGDRWLDTRADRPYGP